MLGWMCLQIHTTVNRVAINARYWRAPCELWSDIGRKSVWYSPKHSFKNSFSVIDEMKSFSVLNSFLDLNLSIKYTTYQLMCFEAAEIHCHANAHIAWAQDTNFVYCQTSTGKTHFFHKDSWYFLRYFPIYWKSNAGLITFWAGILDFFVWKINIFFHI